MSSDVRRIADCLKVAVSAGQLGQDEAMDLLSFASRVLLYGDEVRQPDDAAKRARLSALGVQLPA